MDKLRRNNMNVPIPVKIEPLCYNVIKIGSVVMLRETNLVTGKVTYRTNDKAPKLCANLVIKAAKKEWNK